MDKKLRLSYYLNLITIITPIFLIIPLSFLQLFGDNSLTLVFIALTCIFPLLYYFHTSKVAIKKQEGYSIFLSITFYFNFIVFMITVLVAFNFIVIGGFLFAGDSPIGMDLEKSQAPSLILLGAYLILVSANGMYYLSTSKKKILSQPPSPLR